ncbi:2-hydroxyacid dehydrogenase [Aquitalea sp. LB_tupeE]|uniref:2-hydroxyacid dehydrogenase n=1 Tax=Aquitalea sp. LB_tupeE TaxID=2748078 RepID=UPI0015BED6AC|nr:2-hydroxyacid dehydrogenase [Aquitalea sp. LB_tupeE]NWK79965.1 2-hydroxyacid dehydrogenase [Aquitalea sp. LB_tupeE]
MMQLANRPVIFIVVPLAPALMAQLNAQFECLHGWELQDALRAGEVWPAVRAVVTTGGAGASRQLLQALPAVELVACVGVGFDAIDLDYARTHGIAVTTTPGVLDRCVADTALALLLAVFRQLLSADAFVRQGRWLAGGFPLARSLSGKRCGIVGLGNIGRAIARRAEAFDMAVCYYGPSQKADVAYPYFADLTTMAAAVDVLVLALPGGVSTRHVVDGRVMDALGADGVLINIARGSVVDQAALVERLLDGRLGGAGLDVFEHEPQVPEVLFGLPNVVLTPHMASATVETRAAMAQLMLDNLRAHFSGQPLLTPLHLDCA